MAVLSRCREGDMRCNLIWDQFVKRLLSKLTGGNGAQLNLRPVARRVGWLHAVVFQPGN